MVIMFRMSPEKRERYIKKLDKMSEFVDEFKECLEEASEEESMYRHEDEEDEMEYVKVPKSRYARMMKRSSMK